MVELDRIYNDDCMNRLWELDDHSVDLTILDPNYDDWDKLCKEGLICQSVRVTKLTGNIIMFTKQPFDYNLRNEINHIFRREIVWTFCNGGAWVSKRMPLVSFQKLYWCTLSKDFYFNERTGVDYSDGTRDFKRSSKVFEGYKADGKQFTKSSEGVWLRDHLHYNKPSFGSIPAKPIELVGILLRCFCPDGGIVLDPFMGSGTTAVACRQMQRHYIGFEISKECCDLIRNRLDKTKTLFDL